ncbi:MAG: beta-propeller domain-containing protein [Oscillospiraceae bacterium]|nr:beta-propeller domain-containing protein [Oscillospiraceae bacterium]
MLKRITALVIAVVMLLSLTACKTSVKTGAGSGNGDGDKQQNGGDISGDNYDESRIAVDYGEIYQAVKLANDEQFNYNNGVKYSSSMAIRGGAMSIFDEIVEDDDEVEEYDKSYDIPAKGGDLGGGDDTEFSDTNNQVEGVQESDIVKTDGKHIFVVSNNHDYIYGGGTSGKISVVEPDNGEMELIAQISLENAYPQELLLYNDKLIIIWNKSEYIDTPTARMDRMEDMGWGGSVHAQQTVLQVYDLDGDFEEPASVYSQDGGYTSSRMIGEYIYLITNFTPDIPQDFEEEEIDLYIPSFSCNDKRTFVAPGCIVLPDKLDWIQYSVIGGLNVNEEDMSVSVFSNLGATGFVYANNDNIYLTRSVHEGIRGMEEMLYYYGGETYSIIDKFAINAGEISYTATGKAKGGVENQFRFDEYNGIFRVVTSVWGLDPDIDTSDIPKRPEQPEEPQSPDFGGDWQKWDEWYNDVYMNWYNDVYNNWYEENKTLIQGCDKWWSENYGNQGGALYTFDGDMNILGEVHGIAKGENVQSVRFVGDIGYIVTFKQVDPLFSFDLSDPTSPVKLDELKIPGFSRYLHPWSDGLLLGLGVHAVEDGEEADFGRRMGLKLSMFDVSDNEELSERHVYIIENPDGESWSNSPIESEHKAALVAPDRNLIGFPYSYSEYTVNDNGYSGYKRTAAYAVFTYDNDGFSLIGEISIVLDENDWWEFNRGMYIGDYIYAISNGMIVSAAIGDELVKVQELKF